MCEVLSYAGCEVKPHSLDIYAPPQISGIIEHEEHLRESYLEFRSIIFI